MKYFEAFGGNGYHSAFLTTYALSAQAFALSCRQNIHARCFPPQNNSVGR